jgi:exopolyphosphatase/pppGpp-phosphohydrolase
MLKNPDDAKFAVIDVGSNSVRMVIYDISMTPPCSNF